MLLLPASGAAEAELQMLQQESDVVRYAVRSWVVHALAEVLDDFVDDVMEVGPPAAGEPGRLWHATSNWPAPPRREVQRRAYEVAARLDPQQVRGSRQAAVRDVRRLWGF